jgi:glycerol-3-phosphate dehydrogenase
VNPKRFDDGRKVRPANLSNVPDDWELIIVGGGITGAGILREAARAGVRVILIEQRDFAWGTSSRSSKMVHGGLRYLREGHFFLTKAAVEERDRLLKEAAGLVEPLGFYLPVYENQHPGRRTLKVGLSVYDIIARERHHRYFNALEFLRRMPFVHPKALRGGYYFVDAQVDDARLVLRLINESVLDGAVALNYTAATRILRNPDGNVAGVAAVDVESGDRKILRSNVVINATGCWAEKLHPSPEPGRHLRPLRGSHLVIKTESLPLSEGFSFMHPLDNRAVFVVPWEGAVLVGTTDIDHKQNLSSEPRITDQELAYLLEGIQNLFPALQLTGRDCVCTFAGVRPVLSEGRKEPSAESRDHVVWVDRGLVTVTGGKLTTFRRLAFDALKAARTFFATPVELDKKAPVFEAVPETGFAGGGTLSIADRQRLFGRYGREAGEILAKANPGDLTRVPGTHTLWAELPHVAANEQVRHLADLMLRRVRIGLLTPEGGKAYLKRVRSLCQPVMPWNRRRWKSEIADYLQLWHQAHAPPGQRRKSGRRKPGGFLGKAGDAFLGAVRRLIERRPPK